VKKTACIVCYDELEAKPFREQLGSLFLDAVDLYVHVIGDARLGGDEKPIAADLVLFPSFDAFKRTRLDLSRVKHILFAERTISNEGFNRLSAVEPGTDLVLADETREMAEELVGVLLRMGFTGPVPLPAAFGDEAAMAGKTAIVFGAVRPAPRGAVGVIDVGEVLLDVGTIIDMGIRLDLDPLFHRHSIQNSYRELMTANLGLADILGKMNRCEGSLDIIVRLIDAGVVSVNAEGKISSCNEQAAVLLGLKASEIMGTPASRSFPRLPFRTVLETKSPIVDRLETIRGREIGYSIDPILHSGMLYGAVAVFSGKGDRERKPYSIDTRQLNKGYRARYTFEDLVAESDSMRKCRDIAKRTADSASSVLISGESGTGKEVIAQAIHNASGRRGHPFVAVNCGALPESLLESELFGYEEGAFTGARKGGKPGLFELAHHGTLFLDEMGSMPLSIQMRLLRVLEEREVMRLGGDSMVGVDIRVIAATNRDLRLMVAEGSFREDLYYRLNVLPIYIPPLRERPEDVMPLARRFQRQFNFSFDVDADVESLLMHHRWPGNARELRNYVEYIANLGIHRVGLDDLPRGELQIPASVPIPASEPVCADGDAKIEFILGELDKAYERQVRLGRRSLYSAARERHLFMSEQEIRSILKQLESEALVTIKPGKGGTLITQLGKEALANMKRD
jgi:transcriptional regulator with PAS, ATPase and Fis domain